MKNYSLKLLVYITLTLCLMDTYSQNTSFIHKVLKQDSTLVKNHKSWVDISFGPSLTQEINKFGFFVLGPTLGFTSINRNYQLFKIKTSFHSDIAIFENYPQYTGEIDFMTGKIKVFPKYNIEFYYGIGYLFGRKRVDVISSSDGGSSGFSIHLPHTEYKKKDFRSIGVPFEYKIQWPIFGLGIDGNLNPYLPYVGTKLYVKIGNKYRR